MPAVGQVSNNSIFDMVSSAAQNGDHLTVGKGGTIEKQSKIAHFFETMFSSKATLQAKATQLKETILQKMQEEKAQQETTGKARPGLYSGTSFGDRYNSLFPDNSQPVTRQEYVRRLTVLTKCSNLSTDEIKPAIEGLDFKNDSASVTKAVNQLNTKLALANEFAKYTKSATPEGLNQLRGVFENKVPKDTWPAAMKTAWRPIAAFTSAVLPSRIGSDEDRRTIVGNMLSKVADQIEKSPNALLNGVDLEKMTQEIVDKAMQSTMADMLEGDFESQRLYEK